VFVDGVNQYGPGALYAYTETDADTVTFTSGLHVGAEVKFTTTQQQSAGAVDAQQVSYEPPFTGAVATNVEAKLAQYVNVFDFMSTSQIADVQARTRVLDVSAAVQTALNYAWANGKTLFMPAGDYKAKITTPAIPAEPRGLAFIMQGEGAGSVFLGNPYVKGTTIVSPDTSSTLTIDNILTASDSGPQVHIRDIRFEGTSTNPVLQIDVWNDFCEIRNCEIRQDGVGGGIAFTRAYGGTIKETHIANGNLAGTGTATGTGVDVGTPYSGALLTFYKVSSRGFNTAFSLGSGSGTYILSTELQDCECAFNNYGVLVNDGMRKTIINGCYFEGIAVTAIQDQGDGTTISNCMMFEGPATQIKADYDTRGNLYFGNYIQLAATNQVGINVKGSGDATGYAKTVRDNFIYFLNSGGSVAGVVGIYLQGSNPAVNIDSNTFRPRRAWVGGAGTASFTNASTGTVIGIIPQTDSLNSFPLLSSYSLRLASNSSALTQSDVAAGVLTIPVAGSSFTLGASSPVNVTQIAATNQTPRLVLFMFNNSNMTFKKGTYMLLSADFSGAGSMLCDLQILGGNVYLYELSRTLY
jgi:hypothetical protein